MKIVALLSCILSFAAISNAQAIMRFEIPFDFSVRNKVFPAGKYTLQSVDDQKRLWVIEGKSVKNIKASLLANTIESVSLKSPAKLQFRAYGNRYFLAGLTTSNYQIILPKTKDEQLLRLLNRSLSNTQTVSEFGITEVSVAGQDSVYGPDDEDDLQGQLFNQGRQKH